MLIVIADEHTKMRSRHGTSAGTLIQVGKAVHQALADHLQVYLQVNTRHALPLASILASLNLIFIFHRGECTGHVWCLVKFDNPSDELQ